MVKQNERNGLLDLLASTRSLELECIRLRKTLSYIRRRKSRGLPIEENQMREDVAREMEMYCEHVRKYADQDDELSMNDDPQNRSADSEYWLLTERENYSEYLGILKEELQELKVQ